MWICVVKILAVASVYTCLFTEAGKRRKQVTLTDAILARREKLLRLPAIFTASNVRLRWQAAKKYHQPSLKDQKLNVSADWSDSWKSQDDYSCLSRFLRPLEFRLVSRRKAQQFRFKALLNNSTSLNIKSVCNTVRRMSNSHRGQINKDVSRSLNKRLQTNDFLIIDVCCHNRSPRRFLNWLLFLTFLNTPKIHRTTLTEIDFWMSHFTTDTKRRRSLSRFESRWII